MDGMDGPWKGYKMGCIYFRRKYSAMQEEVMQNVRKPTCFWSEESEGECKSLVGCVQTLFDKNAM